MNDLILILCTVKRKKILVLGIDTGSDKRYQYFTAGKLGIGAGTGAQYLYNSYRSGNTVINGTNNNRHIHYPVTNTYVIPQTNRIPFTGTF